MSGFFTFVPTKKIAPSQALSKAIESSVFSRGYEEIIFRKFILPKYKICYLCCPEKRPMV